MLAAHGLGPVPKRRLLAVHAAVTGCRSAIAFAKLIGQSTIVTLLTESLSEKRNAASMLFQLAEGVE